MDTLTFSGVRLDLHHPDGGGGGAISPLHISWSWVKIRFPKKSQLPKFLRTSENVFLLISSFAHSVIFL